MTTRIVKMQCSICNDEEDTYQCNGCLEIYCFNDLIGHREIINKEFNKIEDDYNSFRQILYDKKDDPKIYSLIKEIDQWEEDSINKIKQTAEECKQKLINYKNKYFGQIENKLSKLTNQIQETRKKNKFNEIFLNQIKQKLDKLKEELEKSSNITIKQESSTFINKIVDVISFNEDTKWKQDGITIAGGNGEGNQLNQLFSPYGIFIDDDQTIYITDCQNDRIVEWKYNATNGQIVAGGNGGGNQTNQLHYPTDVIIDKENDCLIMSDYRNRRVMRWSRQNNTKNGQIIISNIACWGLTMDKDGYLYVSDYEKNEVRRWKTGDKKETIVAGGNGNGDQLNQLNSPTYIFIDEDYSLYVSDSDNHRVMKWIKDAKEGIIVAGGNGEGNSLTQLSRPYGVIVDLLGQIYVADLNNDRVMLWCKGAKEGTIIVGGNGEGEQSNQFNGPTSLSLDRQENLYVVDCNNNRVQKFEINLNEDTFI